MSNEFEDYKLKTLAAEKSTSKTFCLAKWYQANIYFQTGETHSCYHPAPHAIDVDEIKINPSALHNTVHKMNERQEMLKGIQTKGCQYCWSIENLNKNLISDRHIRTGSIYNETKMNEVALYSDNSQVSPDYVEISFSNLCNFKCGYCHPKASSRYLNEIKQFGPYTQSKNHRCDIDFFKIYAEENNPYLEAWWKWWPELSKTLKTLRITGGEPLIQSSTYKMFDYLEQYPSPSLELNVNSNLGSSEAILQKFTSRINTLVKNQVIKKFKLYTSIDTWGSQAEYIRTGLDLRVFENNLKNYLIQTDQPLTIMITFNIFSLLNFTELLKKIIEWRNLYPNAKESKEVHRIRFDISYLKEPLQYDINLLPKNEFMPLMQSHLEFIKNNTADNDPIMFSQLDYQRFLRVYEYMKHTNYSDEKIKEGRQDFYHFFKEHDRRRNCSLLDNFPELAQFWKTCQSV